MNKRKRFCLLFGAFLWALLCIELILPLGPFPKYFITRYYYLQTDPAVEIKIYPPYYEAIIGESRQKIKFNESGLPGYTVPQEKKLLVCGSSYVWGQYKMSFIASSLLQEKLLATKSNVGVYNLADESHDPYRSFHRLMFFEPTYTPDYLFYVIENPEWENAIRNYKQPLQFTGGYVKKEHGKIYKMVSFLRTQSRLLNISAISFKEMQAKSQMKKKSAVDRKKYAGTPLMFATFLKFKEKYQDKFVLVNISNEREFNEDLKNFCAAHQINYAAKNLMKPENRINGKGHLNLRGNSESGEFLYKTFLNREK